MHDRIIPTGSITNRMGCVLIFHRFGAGAQHMWCGCLTLMVRMVCTTRAEGSHHCCIWKGRDLMRVKRIKTNDNQELCFVGSYTFG